MVLPFGPETETAELSARSRKTFGLPLRQASCVWVVPSATRMLRGPDDVQFRPDCRNVRLYPVNSRGVGLAGSRSV